VNGLLSRLGPNFVLTQYKRFVELGKKPRAGDFVGPRLEWMRGLIFYGSDQNARMGRVATYIDKFSKAQSRRLAG
jgi:hypothetical protein